MDLVESGLQKARVHLAQRRIRLDDFFSDFDHLRAGRITREQFRRALTVNGIELSLAELDAVCEAFDYTKVARVPGKGSSHRPAPAGLACKHEINYGAFLQALAESKPPRELLTSTTRRPLSLSPEEESRLLPTVQMLRHAVQAKGISIIPPFKDMDPLNTGKVTASQFERCIPFQTLDPSILKLFVRKYGDGQGNVYYNMWCREVDPTLQEKDELQAAVTAINTAPSSLFFSGSYKNPKLSSDELIRILREQFALYKLRCEDYFTDFDRFKTGTVTPPQFESALGRLNFVKFSLTEENVEALVQAYTVNPADPKDPTVGAFARVNYRSFLYDTNPKNFPVISADGHESTNYFISTHAADTFMRHTDELEAANRVLEKVRRLVKSNRIFLSPVLRDFDRVRKMIYEHRTCTSSRFGRGLATQNLILPPEELNVLIRKYTIPHPDGSASQDVNYYEFVQDVDPSQASVPGAVTTGAVVRGVLAQLQKEADHTRLRPATDLDELLQKIAQRAELRELRVGEFFLDFDPLRGGTLQQDKFITALGIAGLQLQDPEIELLKATYPSDKVRCHIDTARFLRDVGAYAPQSVPPTMLGGTMVASSTVANVAPAPAAEEAVAAASEDGVKKVSVAPFSLCSEAVQRLRLTEDERTRLSRLLFRLRHEVKTHSALLTPFFSDFDRFHHGKIPRMNFEQALARHRFVLSETDTDLLCRYYAVPTDPEMEDYRRFINEVGFEEGATWNTYTCAAAAAAAAAAVEAATTAGSAGQTSAANLTDCAEDAELQAVLAKVCCFLQERNPRVSEFFPDGDELRHQHVTLTRFRHCVSILGLHLTEPELHVLERAFASGRVEGEADYPAFVYTVRRMLDEGAGLRAVEQRRMGVPASGASTSVEEKVLAVAMDKIRRTLATRHTTALPAFREYDRTRKGQVKEGQFFVSLRALGVQLSPQEAGVVGKAFSLGNGEVGYIRFCKETDGAVSA